MSRLVILIAMVCVVAVAVFGALRIGFSTQQDSLSRATAPENVIVNDPARGATY